MEQSSDKFKHITPQELDALDPDSVILIDVRERAESLISGIDHAVNMPLSEGYDVYNNIPRDKLVVVFCRGGVLSRQAAAVLANRGYDVATLDGGYNAYRMFKMAQSEPKTDNACPSMSAAQTSCQCSNQNVSAQNVSAPSCSCSTPAAKQPADDMQSDTKISETLDVKDMKCPGPIVRVADCLKDKPVGYRILVEAVDESFTSDIAVWCDRTGNRLDSLTNENGVIKAVVTRAAALQSAGRGNDKSFVIFSDDLDKAIAAFIIANGAASLGRKVTMFFTFWGLNILRRHEKVKVKKTFMERMFAAFMPRGASRLKLSQMNMFGLGTKMVRRAVKKKCINTLEELIAGARSHGVRLVACQMTMDLLGIRKEELIDGVKLGGVTAFIGAGEQSDMNLFI